MKIKTMQINQINGVAHCFSQEFISKSVAGEGETDIKDIGQFAFDRDQFFLVEAFRLERLMVDERRAAEGFMTGSVGDDIVGLLFGIAQVFQGDRD